MLLLGDVERLGGGLRLGDRELLVQLQLLGQRMAQRRIIIDDQYLATRRHLPSSARRRSSTRLVTAAKGPFIPAAQRSTVTPCQKATWSLICAAAVFGAG